MIKNQLWNPWIGEEYFKQKVKILLIGESHYAQNQNREACEISYKKFTENENATIEIIKLLINGDSWNLFDNTYRVLSGKKDIEKSKFWNKISFFNLIQRPMKTSAERPSNKDFRENVDLSLKIIEEMNETPDRIIYLGNSGRHFFEKAIEANNSFTIEKKTVTKVGRYIGVTYKMRNPENLNIYFIKHPSKYFSWLKWREFLFSDDLELKEYLQENIS
jgi:hypothetical protein